MECNRMISSCGMTLRLVVDVTSIGLFRVLVFQLLLEVRDKVEVAAAEEHSDPEYKFGAVYH